MGVCTLRQKTVRARVDYNRILRREEWHLDLCSDMGACAPSFSRRGRSCSASSISIVRSSSKVTSTTNHRNDTIFFVSTCRVLDSIWVNLDHLLFYLSSISKQYDSLIGDLTAASFADHPNSDKFRSDSISLRKSLLEIVCLANVPQHSFNKRTFLFPWTDPYSVDPPLPIFLRRAAFRNTSPRSVLGISSCLLQREETLADRRGN